MYEELIKRLRSHNGWALNKTLDEAADAIEELSGLVDHYGGETGIKNLQEYANKYWDLLKKCSSLDFGEGEVAREHRR